jgi:hypothetical protein
MVATFRQRFRGPVRPPGALVSSPISVFVHDHGIEAVGGRLLDVGLGQAALDGPGVVLPALAQAAVLLVPGRCFHEHQQRVRVRVLHREGALDVNLEQHVVAGSQVLLDRTARRSVEVPVHLEPLQELVGRAQAVELFAIEEQIVLAVDLAFATRTRRGRHREPQPRVAVAELAHDRPLADPGRAREDEQDAQGAPPISRSASAALRAGCGRGRAGAGSR